MKLGSYQECLPLSVFLLLGNCAPVCAGSTIRGTEAQHLAALYHVVRLSPWKKVRKRSIPGWVPLVPPDLYSPRRLLLLVPQSPGLRDTGPHPTGNWSGPSPGWLPPVLPDLVSLTRPPATSGPCNPSFSCTVLPCHLPFGNIVLRVILL